MTSAEHIETTDDAEARAAHYLEKGYWTGRNLIEFFDDAVAAHPEKIAFKDDRFGAITYGDMARSVERLSGVFLSRGIAKGDRFIVALPNWQQFPVVALALNNIGAVAVHLPITGGPHEFGGVLRLTDAKGIAVPTEFAGRDFVGMIDGIADNHENLQFRIAVGADCDRPEWHEFDKLVAEEPAGGPYTPERALPSDLMCILFTSGSSGDPKGVMHSSNTLSAMNTTTAPLYGLNGDDVIFMGAPFGYSGGLVHGYRLAIYLGATLVVQEAWDAEQAMTTIAREKAAFTMLTPTLLSDMFATKAYAEYGDQVVLKLIFCGGAYVPEELLRYARKQLPNTLTSVIWGMTEGIGTGSRPDTPVEKVVGTDGRPFLGTEIKIIRENDEDADVGEEGDLVMRGPQCFLSYYKRPDLNEEVFMPGGWVRTGDMGAIDAEGFLRISGRRKDLIIRGGANIAPAEIEDLLREDPRIHEIVVVGIPDARLDERICACVVLNEGAEKLELDDLVESARSQGLAKNKWPERLEFVDEMPLTSSGKLQRLVLKKNMAEMIATEKEAG